MQPQQGKTQRHHQVHRPADQPASVVRHFARREGAGEEGDAIPEHGQTHGREEDDGAEHVDPDLGALGQAAGDHVHLDVFALEQRVASGQQERRGKQVPLDFQKTVGADVERFADHGVHTADDCGGQDEPDHVFADLGVKPVDPP
ncbi:hypothetical protein D3C72_1659500 [compost metagenome]